MKPTLKEIEDNYERVLLRLHSGELAGIVKNKQPQLQVLRKRYWIDRVITTADLDDSYNRKNSITDFNIDAIAFMNDADGVDYCINNYDPKNIAWDWDINNPQCDDQMDAYVYWLSARNMNKSQRLETFRKAFFEGVDNMNNILEIYVDRRSEKINKKYDELENSVKLTDARYKVWKECVDTLDKLYTEDKILNFAHANIELSEDTKKKLHTLYEAREEEFRKLFIKRNEVDAQLSMCETYDQKQEILRRYNIINKNGRVNG